MIFKRVNGKANIYKYDDFGKLLMIISMMQKKKESHKNGQIRKIIIMINGIITANHSMLLEILKLKIVSRI